MIFKKKKKNKECKVVHSFYSSLFRTSHPVITFNCGEKELNFIIDTGSSDSHICPSAVLKLNTKDYKVSRGEKIKTLTAASKIDISSYIETTLRYNNVYINQRLYLNKELDPMAEALSKECGIEICGVLGSDFLIDTSSIIDYKDFVITFHIN